MSSPDIHEFKLPAQSRFNKYSKIALGGAAAVAVGLLATEAIRDDPKYSIENMADQSALTTIDLTTPNLYEGIGPVEYNSVGDGEATSDAVERSTLAFIQEYGVITKEGQASTVQEDAKIIEATVRAETGGSVPPDTKFETWYDEKSGYIISSLPSDKND